MTAIRADGARALHAQAFLEADDAILRPEAFTREERHQRQRDGHAGPVQRLDREGVEKPGQRQEKVGAGSGSTT